ncbi:hypothetical protein C1645_838797 [Glomus cerebriforme]|uniref:Uncharacterized protein n=1 Tax=Glomus cerebriforme TaxID=658196 RepID=A0A397SCD5_9GLOM|nr:hypothetical protein C1645_838797 [Glomus cerebriforme]
MSTYPASNVITLNQNSTHYTYTIIKEGYYPQNDIFHYISARSCNNTQFKIPDNYLIQTSWDRGISKHTIQYEINYIENIPIFKILFGENFQECIKKPNTQTRLSGIHVFCLNSVNHFHPDDCPVLQEICFTVQNKHFQTNFRIQNKEKENQRNEAFTRVIDQGPIAQNSYRNLAALQPELPQINYAIPISILNISNQSSLAPINENPDINDPEIVEEILKYIDLISQHVLNSDNPIINLRISGDGRNVGRKVKHVMITCTILDDIANLYKSDNHYTIILYPGGENYELLQRMITPIVNELNDLVLNRLKDSNGKIWTIKPYFSSDWKFMAIVLGFNTSNSKYFCP